MRAKKRQDSHCSSTVQHSCILGHALERPSLTVPSIPNNSTHCNPSMSTAAPRLQRLRPDWIPAYAGMTGQGGASVDTARTDEMTTNKRRRATSFPAKAGTYPLAPLPLPPPAEAAPQPPALKRRSFGAQKRSFSAQTALIQRSFSAQTAPKSAHAPRPAASPPRNHQGSPRPKSYAP